MMGSLLETNTHIPYTTLGFLFLSMIFLFAQAGHRPKRCINFVGKSLKATSNMCIKSAFPKVGPI